MKLLDEAKKHLGVKENINGKSNPVILGWYKDLGMPEIKDCISIAWCGTFVAYCCLKAGYKGLSKAENFLGARNWSKVKTAVRLQKPAEGAVVVFWRGSPQGWQGHVGIVAGRDTGGSMAILGGNQDNMVKISPYGTDRVVGYYWLQREDGVKEEPNYNLPLVGTDGKRLDNEA